MKLTDTRHLLAALLAFAAIAVIGLWSWNTLAELFGAPEAQFKHAIAALALITTLRLALLRRHPAFRRRRHP
jgi:predicted benzoate:H+ symporter BenE